MDARETRKDGSVAPGSLWLGSPTVPFTRINDDPQLSDFLRQVSPTLRVTGVLGKGATGISYLVHEASAPQTKLVLKVVPPQADALPHAGTRFGEVQRSAQLTHPAAARILACHQLPSGHVLILRELILGETLRARLRRQAPLPLPLAVHLCQQIAACLSEAHQGGLCHGDLTPGNLFVTFHEDQRGPSVKIVDFGVASPFPISARGHIGPQPRFGTPEYMSPEQARGEKITARSEQFVLASLFYEIISGYRAFARSGDSAARILERVLHEDPRSISTPPRIERALRLAFNRLPNSRHPSLLEFVEALQPPAPAPKAPPPVRRLSDRWRIILPMVAATLVSSAVVYLVLGRRVTTKAKSTVAPPPVPTASVPPRPGSKAPAKKVPTEVVAPPKLPSPLDLPKTSAPPASDLHASKSGRLQPSVSRVRAAAPMPGKLEPDSLKSPWPELKPLATVTKTPSSRPSPPPLATAQGPMAVWTLVISPDLAREDRPLIADCWPPTLELTQGRTGHRWERSILEIPPSAKRDLLQCLKNLPTSKYVVIMIVKEKGQ